MNFFLFTDMQYEDIIIEADDVRLTGTWTWENSQTGITQTLVASSFSLDRKDLASGFFVKNLLVRGCYLFTTLPCSKSESQNKRSADRGSPRM